MKKLLTGRFRNLFLYTAIIYTGGYLFSCCTPWLSPCNYSWLTYAALGFPFLLAGFILTVIPYSLIVFKKSGWLSLLFLLPAIKNIGSTISFHSTQKFVQQKQKKQVRILSWNVDAFLYRPYSAPEIPENQAAMVNFIRGMDADILCFQDFSETPAVYGKVNIAFLSDSLGYPYHYFSEDGTNYGTIIFSRLPIIDSGHLKYKERVYPESLAYIDVQHDADTLRVYNTHLRSMNLHVDKYDLNNIGYLEFVKEDTAVLFHSNRLQRLEYFDCIHVQQAETIKQQLTSTRFPYVFCADLNSVPASYVYHYISKGLTDAFITCGAGLGQTYYRFSPTLRIDVMLMSTALQPVQYYSPALQLSDHYPVVTDIEMKR